MKGSFFIKRYMIRLNFKDIWKFKYLEYEGIVCVI